jgi:hypothetical protein
MELEKITLSLNRTHHLYKETPLYSKKFTAVEKFHQPGFAPVTDSTGAYHIDINGNEAYNSRFGQSFGFYCELAAVEKNGEWFHILPNGTRAYSSNYDWLGNFQEDICVAKKDGTFYHINKQGEPIYQERYNYVGDFKDGIAVVHLNGDTTHITTDGNFLHNKWFKRLDIFHKGYACAKDDNGWFHLDSKGNELYQERYKHVEPFYNKLALVENFDGQIKQINIKNEIAYEVRKKSDEKIISELFGDLVGFWKTKLISIAVKLNLLELLPNNTPKLALKLKIPNKNLFRLLRALWELDIIKYNHLSDIWSIGNKGQILKSDQFSFLQNAAILWDKISQLDWDKLTEILILEEISSFKSFKDIEKNPIYQKAVDGYLKLYIEKIINELSSIGKSKNVLCLGRSAGLLASSMKKYGITHVDSITNLDQLIENTKNYKTVVMLKFIHYFDDKKAEKIIELLHQSEVNEIFIFEMLVSKDKPNGGILDINMIIECGGKLRNIVDFTLLLNRYEYKISETKNINPYLQMIYAKK